MTVIILGMIGGGIVGFALFSLDEIRKSLGRIEKLLEKQRDPH